MNYLPAPTRFEVFSGMFRWDNSRWLEISRTHVVRIIVTAGLRCVRADICRFIFATPYHHSDVLSILGISAVNMIGR